MFFEISNGMSTNKNQDFIWAADYISGKHLIEFEPNGKENSFYMIDRNSLLRFGLIGCGHKMYFDSINGVFTISGRKIEMEYIDENGNVYNLTNCPGTYYNDILQFKSAESNFNPMDISRKVRTNINEFNFGYKQKLVFNDINFNLKVICKIPYNSPIYLEITLTSNKNLNGRLVLRRNGQAIDAIKAPLKEGMKGTLNWDIL